MFLKKNNREEKNIAVSDQVKTTSKGVVGHITSGLDKLPTKVAESAPVKALCFFGCLDEKLRRSASESKVAKWIAKLRWQTRVVKPMKRSFASAVEQSRVLDILWRFLNFFYTLPILCYGMMVFSIGITLCGTAAITSLIQGSKDLLSLALLDLPMMIPGIILILLSFPFLLADNQPLSLLVENSRFGRSFLCGFLGLDIMNIRRDATQSHFGGFLSVIALSLGVTIGVITRYVNPYVIPITVLSVLLVVTVMNSPEAGLLLLTVLLPLCGPTQLCMLSTLVIISFFVKLMRGKRSMKLTMTDNSFLFLAVIILFECVIFDSGRMFGIMSILFCLIVVVGSQLLHRQRMAVRFQRALLVSSFIAVLAISVDIALEYVPAWMLRDISLHSFSSPIISNFDSRSGVGLYLFLLFPFVMSAFYLSGKMHSRFAYLMYGILLIGGLVMTKSRTVWIGCIFLLVMFLLLRSARHLITVLFTALISVAGIIFFLPDRYLNIIKAYFSGSDSRILSAFSEFWDALTVSFQRYFTGEGLAQPKGNNMYTIIISALGLVGFLTFILAMLLLIGYATVSVLRSRSATPKLRPMMVACYTSVFGMLLVAIRLPALDHPGVLLAFCLVCGFTMGVGRTMRKNAVLSEAVTEEDVEFSPIFYQGGDRNE